MIDKAKEYVNANRKNIIIGVVLLVVCVACWGMFSGGIPDIGSGIDKARAELSAARAELDAANRQLSESQAVIDNLRRTNIDLTNEIRESRAIVDTLRQANSDIASEIDRSSVLNKSNLELVRDSQQGLRTVRKTGEARNP
jgi:septal ring factor EnvC (AmiA/AmiB activator)